MAAVIQKDLDAYCRTVLARLSTLWDFPGLAETVQIQVSSRLTRALARVAMDRRIVRLAVPVAAGPRPALAEILTHEAAHIVVYDRHGRAARPHGREWGALMRAAGYQARARVDAAELGIVMPAPKRRRSRPRYVYEHRCPVCQTRQLAGRVVRQWRCAACHDAGLSGELEVRRRQPFTRRLAAALRIGA